jgi:hypothetical protein
MTVLQSLLLPTRQDLEAKERQQRNGDARTHEKPHLFLSLRGLQ